MAKGTKVGAQQSLAETGLGELTASGAEALRLQALASYKALDARAEAAIERVLALAADLFDAPVALVSLVEDERQRFSVRFGLATLEAPRYGWPCAEAVRLAAGSILVVEDARADERFADHPLIAGEPGVRFYAGALLSTPDGCNLGTLCVLDDRPRARPPPAALDRLAQLARMVTDEFEQARTARLTAETTERLRIEDRYWRVITEHAGDIILCHDFEGRRKFVSPSIEKVLGYTAREALGGSVPSLLHPDHRPMVDDVFKALSEGLDHKVIQHRSRHKDGRYIWLETNLQLVRDADGAPHEIVSVSRDISRRKDLELALIAARDEAREQAQRALLAEEIVGLGHWRFDLQAQKIVVSPKMFEIYGLPFVQDPEAESFHALIHPDDRDRTMPRVAERLRAGSVDQNVPTRIRRPDGQVRWVACGSIVIDGADGAPAYLMGTVRDITDEQNAKVELAESEARYRLLADGASDMITACAPSGEITFISPSCRQILGFDQADLLGRCVVDLVHPDDRAKITDHCTAMVREGPGASRPYQFRGRHRDGGWVWLESHPKLVFDESGALMAIHDVARDVTARKAMEAALEQARAAAESAAAVKSEFLSNMSHELRTPLTAVLGFSRLIEEQPELSSVTRTYLDRVTKAGKVLLSTVNDILDFSRLEAGQVEVKVYACDPRQIIVDSMDLFTAEAEEKGVALALIGDERLPVGLVLAPERVRQVLLNLIGNAVKFTDEGRVQVEAAWNAAQGALRVSVRDSGPGIAADRLDQLFKRFSQIEGSLTRRHGGSGLGLAICKGLVDAMGGRIGVSSTPGQGSCFWFELPAQEAVPAPLPTEIAEAGQTGAVWKVLIVDDNAVNRELARTVLTAFGAETVEAADGEAAVTAAATQTLDVVLMDLHMPGMGGQAAAELIRRGPLNSQVAIIAFSADVARAPAAVFDGAVTKPLEAMHLISEIKRVLERGMRSETAA